MEFKECIITEQYNCPHEEISGKICGYCKIPESTCPNCGGTNYEHYLNCHVWKKLVEIEGKNNG